MNARRNQPVLPAVWQRHDDELLPLWRDRLCREMGPDAASRFAGGLFSASRRYPIAQWFNPALDAALLVGLETAIEWPVQRFGLFYAPAGNGVIRVNMNTHEWFPRTPHQSPTEEEAFAAAVESAESFLRVEMDFI